MISEQEVLEFIQKLDPDDKETIEADDSLFKGKRLNSITIIQLIAFIETKLDRKLESEEITLENFDSVTAIREAFHE